MAELEHRLTCQVQAAVAEGTAKESAALMAGQQQLHAMAEQLAQTQQEKDILAAAHETLQEVCPGLEFNMMRGRAEFFGFLTVHRVNIVGPAPVIQSLVSAQRQSSAQLSDLERQSTLLAQKIRDCDPSVVLVGLPVRGEPGQIAGNGDDILLRLDSIRAAIRQLGEQVKPDSIRIVYLRTPPPTCRVGVPRPRSLLATSSSLRLRQSEQRRTLHSPKQPCGGPTAMMSVHNTQQYSMYPPMSVLLRRCQCPVYPVCPSPRHW